MLGWLYNGETLFTSLALYTGKPRAPVEQHVSSSRDKPPELIWGQLPTMMNYETKSMPVVVWPLWTY